MIEFGEKAKNTLEQLLLSRKAKLRNTGKNIEMIQDQIILDSDLTRKEFDAMVQKINDDNSAFVSRKKDLLSLREKQIINIEKYMLMDDVESAGRLISDARNTVEVIDAQLAKVSDQVDCLDVGSLEYAMKRLEARQKASELSAKLKKEYAKLNALRSDLFDQLIKTQDHAPDECNELTMPERF
jgi:hypothetical protein